MNVYVDADACPVQKEITDITAMYHVPVVFVKSYSHFSYEDNPPHVETIYVDKGKDMADMKIIELVKKDDIIVTQDYGLASLLLQKSCIVIHHKAFMYTEQNIERLLQQRHLSAEARRRGIRTKGPKAFSEQDRDKFIRFFTELLDERFR